METSEVQFNVTYLYIASTQISSIITEAGNTERPNSSWKPLSILFETFQKSYLCQPYVFQVLLSYGKI